MGRKLKGRTKTVVSPHRGIRRSQQGFFPTRGPARYPTAGVVASNFLDGGFRALAANIDSVYLHMTRDIFNEASSKAQKKKFTRLLDKYRPEMELDRLRVRLAENTKIINSDDLE
jgi:hypothetical protein